MAWRDGDAVGTGNDPRLAKSVSTVYQEQHLALDRRRGTRFDPDSPH